MATGRQAGSSSFLHGEGRRLRELLEVDRGRAGADLQRGLVDVAALGAAAAASSVLQRPFYPGLPPQVTAVRVPRWVLSYGALVWPALWGATEEMVYLGYALPWLEAILGRWRAIGLVVLCWGPVQHPTLPALPDRRYVASRALTTLPVVAVQTGLRAARGWRLPPLVLGHWTADLATAVGVALRPRTAG